MRFLLQIRLKLRSLILRRQVEQELDEELQYHLGRQIEENLAAGMLPEDARFAALRLLSNIEQRKEECRDRRGVAAIENVAQDLRYGWRQLRRTPVFTTAAILSLGLGIGASVTMFSAFRAVFLRSLPYHHASRIVEIQKTAQHGYTPSLTAEDLQFLNRYAHSLQSTAAFGFFDTMTLSGVSEPADWWVRDVSAEFFPLLGARPLLGRTLSRSDFKRSAPLVTVLAYDAWNKYFHRDPNIVGRPIFLNGTSYVVVGVMPQGFIFPKAGTAAWLPNLTPATDARHTAAPAVARLRDGASLRQTRDELQRLTPDLLKYYSPSERSWRLRIDEIATRSIEAYRKAFWLLLGAVGLLVLIACLNVASLLLARASVRKGEFAMRSALGAGRVRLIGQVLTESLALAGLSGIVGLGLATLGNRLLLRLLPGSLNIPRMDETHLDGVVLAFAVLLTCCVALFFGMAPALVLSRNQFTRASSQRQVTEADGWRANGLLVGEIAVALILLTGSIVMLRGFVRLANVDPGFRTAHILTAMVPSGRGPRLTKEQLKQRYDRIVELAQNVPGVEQAALTSYLPLGSVGIQLQIYLPDLSSATYQIDFHAVSPDYFRVMGIPLLQGRLFSRSNSGMDKGAVVINRTMAEQYWPGRNAVGQRLSGRPAPAAPDLTVVGVVGDTQHRSLGQAPVPEFYEDYHQYLGPAVGATLVLRTYADPRTVAASLRTAIHRFDPEQVVEREQTLTSMVEQTISAPRFYTALLTTFALLALILTLIGVYGVASYSTSLRKREFAIRMALGAERHELLGMVLRQGLLRAAVGIAVGLLGAFAFTRLLAGVVYGVSVRDPLSFGIAAASLATGALLAYYLPSRRSTKLDPAAVLRQE